MIALKPEPNSDLQYLRQSNPLSQRQKLITGIFDRKLRQLAKLDSKQQILSECQQILIQKVLDYMNQLDQADIKYLQQSQLYTQRIISKEQIIDKLQKILENRNNQLKGKGDEIEKMLKEINGLKLKIEHLESQNEGLMGEREKDGETIREFKEKIKGWQENNFILENKGSILQEQVGYLNEQLRERVGEIDELNRKIKNEGMKYWNQNCDKDEEIEKMKRKLNKELASKQKEISTLQKKVQDIEFTRSSFAEALSSMKSKQLTSCKLDDIVLNEQIDKDMQRKGKVPVLLNNFVSPIGINIGDNRDTSISTKVKVQSHHFQSLATPKPQAADYPLKTHHKQPSKFINIPSLNCQNSPPFLSFSPMKRSLKQQKQPHNYSNNNQEQKQKLKWKAQFKKQFVHTFSELYKLTTDMKKLANDRITLAMTEKNQVEELLMERPSREEDIIRIKLLMDQNQGLVIRLKQEQQRAETAYEAMRLCKQELKRRIDSTPLEISNSPQGRLHHKDGSKAYHQIAINNNQNNQYHRPDIPTVRRVSSMAKANSNSSLTVKRNIKRYTDNSKGEQSIAYCVKEVIGGNNLNLNKYVKRCNSSFSLTREERRRDLKSALS